MSQEFPVEAPPPYIPPPSDAPRKEVAVLQPADLVRWLGAGWRDMVAHPGIGLFYGICFSLMALVLGEVFQANLRYAMSLASGCMLLGPFLAMGLYDVSRRGEQGLQPSLGESLTCWAANLRSMGMLVLVLLVLELMWGRISLVMIAVFFNTSMPSTAVVVQTLFNLDNWEFLLAYGIVGSGFAMLVFSIAVVSIPMILDRDADAISAAITSLEVVFHNTWIMLLWGALITLLVALALLLPWGMGLLLVGPLLGHASWHAYRGAVHWPSTLAGDGA